MKNIIPFAIAVFLLMACGGNKKSNMEQALEDLEKASEELLEASDVEPAKNCEEFVDQYEAWMDDYLGLMEKYQKNPMDAALSAEYLKVSQEAIGWMSQWNGPLITCAGQEKYEKRFDEITARADKKMEELGY